MQGHKNIHSISHQEYLSDELYKVVMINRNQKRESNNTETITKNSNKSRNRKSTDRNQL